VTLQNTGPAAIAFESFDFHISTTDPDITFTSTNINTSSAPYIFAGNSVLGPMINTVSGQTIDGSDLYGGSDTSCSPPPGLPGACVAANTTVGLGNVQFSISGTATLGNFAVTLSQDPALTNLTDPNFNPIAIDTFTNRGINILATPEPASALLLAGALAGVLAMKRRRLNRG